jgi:hypothetical protein
MRTRALTLMWAVCTASCVRSPFPAKVPVEDDRTVAFPAFHERSATSVGESGKHYTWDGELLQAVLIATNDFLPHRTRDVPCGSRLESQRYHVIREGTVIFVYIYEDEGRCGGGYVSLDSGAKYAISAEGRILRRVFDGQPDQPLDGLDLDGGVPARPGVVPGYEPQDASSFSDEQDGGDMNDGGG